MILEITTIGIMYLIIAYISHCGGIGSVIPSWLCIFCIPEYIKSIKTKSLGG